MAKVQSFSAAAPLTAKLERAARGLRCLSTKQHPRRETMKTLATVLAASVIATAAYAQTTVIEKRESVSPGSTTIVKERDPDVVVKKKEMTTGSVGCESKTVQKTDSFGDTKTKTKTEC
jgi:hypothetical protein